MTQSELKKALAARTAWNADVQKQTTVDSRESESQKLGRIKRARRDYAFFCEYYFPQWCKCKSGKFQVDAANYLLKNKDTKAVFKWARGHAKSTNMDVFIPMWLMIQEERQINVMVIVGKSQDNANTLLADIQSELQYNQRYIHDFGEQYNSGHWTEDEFITCSGVAFFARGRGQSPRGLRYKDKRPDYIVIDDLDDDELCLNEQRVKKLTKWVKEALFGALDGGRGRFVMVGNLISKQSVLQNIVNTAGVHTTQVNILDSNDRVTWTERWTREEVRSMEEFMGTFSFNKEYMNNPLSEGDIFKEINWGSCPALSKFKILVLYGDPSPSNNVKAKNSTKALSLVGKLENVYYLLDCRVERVTNAQFCDWIIDINKTVPAGVQVYNFIENNSLQNPFFEQVLLPTFYEKAKSGTLINIIPDARKKPDKFARIEANLEPLNRQQRLIFNVKLKDNPHFKRMEEQFLAVNPQLLAPADGPDCTEGGIWKLNEKLNSMAIGATNVINRKTNNKRI
jgi:hypothetical protein